MSPSSWFKVDSGWFTHPKMLALTDHAVATWFRCLGYCSMHLTDGRVPSGAGRLVGTPETMGELVDAGVLDEAADGWTVVGYLEHQRSKDQAERSKENARERQRLARERKAVDNGSGGPKGLPPAETSASRRDKPRDSGRDSARSSFAEERRGEERTTPPTPPTLHALAIEEVMQRRGEYQKVEGDPTVRDRSRVLASIRKGIDVDLRRQDDYGRLIHDEAPPAAIADLLAPRPRPAVGRPPHDPNCTHCDGHPDAWIELEDGTVKRCPAAERHLQAVGRAVSA